MERVGMMEDVVKEKSSARMCRRTLYILPKGEEYDRCKRECPREKGEKLCDDKVMA